LRRAATELYAIDGVDFRSPPLIGQLFIEASATTTVSARLKTVAALNRAALH
jgi:hypothetical protein